MESYTGSISVWGLRNHLIMKLKINVNINQSNKFPRNNRAKKKKKKN